MLAVIKKIIFFVALFWTLNVSAQSEKIPVSESDYQNTEIEMADTFRDNGKIYVVVAVISVILGGLMTYLVILDRKTTRLEKMILDK